MSSSPWPQMQMSYTLVLTRMSSSASRSIRKVSIVFGCRPSARPVLVWSGRSSMIVDIIPNRARLSLVYVLESALHARCGQVKKQTHASINPAGPAPTMQTSRVSVTVPLRRSTSRWTASRAIAVSNSTCRMTRVYVLCKVGLVTVLQHVSCIVISLGPNVRTADALRNILPSCHIGNYELSRQARSFDQRPSVSMTGPNVSPTLRPSTEKAGM